MNEMFIKLLEIYKSPFLVFSGRFEFTSLYNLIGVTQESAMPMAKGFA
jgi:hypothetical protein